MRVGGVMMWRRITGFIAQFLDRTICYDITNNRKKALNEFQNLIKEPENFKHRLQEFQAESAIIGRFATEKNNRLIALMTFMIMIMTLVFLFR